MSNWTIDFIGERQFKEHVAKTIEAYGENLEPYDIKKLNKNIIDPVKMVFDKNVYQESWAELIAGEIVRQRDKANNNSIGYFHQRIFQYLKGCSVPANGTEGGWDVILRNPDGIDISDGDKVHTVYVEMKNKHNTMNSAAAGKTYIKMQNQLLNDDDCACCLVEAIAKKSQNIKWETSVDGKRVSHRKIRRMSIDQFYSIVTGQEDAFYQICMALPETVKSVIDEEKGRRLPNDTAFQNLKAMAESLNIPSEENAMALAIYLLGFSSYSGFKNSVAGTLDDLYQNAAKLQN